MNNRIAAHKAHATMTKQKVNIRINGAPVDFSKVDWAGIAVSPRIKGRMEKTLRDAIKGGKP